MSKEKKIGLFVGCCVLIILLPFTCTVNKYREVKDAAVCGENGDIAFAFYDEEQNFIVKCVSSDGTELYRKSFHAGSGFVHLEFDGTRLIVYVSQSKNLTAYDRNGELLPDYFDLESKQDFMKTLQGEKLNGWKNWRKKDGRLIFEMEKTKYIYRESSAIKHLIGKGGCKLVICSENGDELTIYQSGVMG